MRGASGVALCLLLAGCWSPSGIRESPAIRQIFTSSKPAELLAGCISDAWTAQDRKTKTNRTAAGWVVIDETEESTFGLADIVTAGGRTTVTYSGPVAGYSRLFHLTGIPPCL